MKPELESKYLLRRRIPTFDEYQRMIREVMQKEQEQNVKSSISVESSQPCMTGISFEDVPELENYLSTDSSEGKSSLVATPSMAFSMSMGAYDASQDLKSSSQGSLLWTHA
ncbi:hypothetical protein NE237_002502 [Protea cynaroides]|uniref:Uncharacterized protein n=1 Tax=Protea cynaroides TaxID=273540 RepID=A0A9Q0KVD0_9MAGN|nr:hypothetical protein NE237_002502 [Protea cynaroides]